MMDNSGLIHYDSRSTGSAPIQRPVMATHYVPMGGSYSMAPMSTMPAPHYPPHNSFGGFATYSNLQPAPVASPYKQPVYHERPNLRITAPEPGRNSGPAFPRDIRPSFEVQSPNPSVKSEDQGSAKSSTPFTPVLTKTITSNAPLHPKDEVMFRTDVDALMKAIQSRNEKQDASVVKAEPDPEKLPSPTPAQTPEAQPQVG
jgi:hypothetical protein